MMQFGSYQLVLKPVCSVNHYIISLGHREGQSNDTHFLQLKGCDSNFEVKCSNFESRYK